MVLLNKGLGLIESVTTLSVSVLEPNSSSTLIEVESFIFVTGCSFSWIAGIDSPSLGKSCCAKLNVLINTVKLKVKSI